MREGLKRVDVESNVTNVIKEIEADSWELSPEGPIFKEIKSIAAQVDEDTKICNVVAGCKSCYHCGRTKFLKGNWTSMVRQVNY